MLGCADIAAAQSTSNLPPSNGASEVGSIVGSLVRRVGIRAGVSANYDSNVFGFNGRGGVLQGRSADDITIRPTLAVDLLLPFGRNSVYTRGSIGYDFHLNNSDLDRERITLDGGGTLQVANSCTISPNINYGRARSNAGDLFIVDGGASAIRRNVEERVTVGGQAACSRTSGLSVTAGYRHTTFRNSVDVFRFNDLNQDGVDGSIGFQRPSLGRLAIYGNYGEVEYVLRGERIKSYGTGIQFERNIGSRASASVSVGYTWVEPQSNTGRFSGSNYSGTLNLRPSDRFSVDLIVSRSVDFANNLFASYTITEVYALNATYRLSPRVRTTFGSSHQKRDFQLQFTQPGGPLAVPISSDGFTRAYGGVVYDLNRRLSLNGLVSQQKRNSRSVGSINNAFFDYTNTTVSIGASLSLGR